MIMLVAAAVLLVIDLILVAACAKLSGEISAYERRRESNDSDST